MSVPLTKEQYIEIGDEFPTRDVLDQLDDSLDLAVRDAIILAGSGWTVRNTAALRGLQTDLVKANKNYERKFGRDVGRTRNGTAEVDNGKRWRLRANAILENNLQSEDAMARLKRLGGAAGRDPEALVVQVEGLLALARENEAHLRAEDVVDDAFFAEGARLARVLRAAATFRRQRPKDLPVEQDRLDELDGRVWEMVKALNRAGRAAHIQNGDRLLAAHYNLDAMYGRPIRRRRPATPKPPELAPPEPPKTG